MSDMQCPYCQAEQEACHDDGSGYSEDQLHEHNCSNCGKTFTFMTTIHFSYSPRKADCLNGSLHELSYVWAYPRQYAKMRCKGCGFERLASKAEADAHDAERMKFK